MSLIDEGANLESLRQTAAMPALPEFKPQEERSAWNIVHTAPRAALYQLAADVGEAAVGVKRTLNQMNAQTTEQARKAAGVDFNGKNFMSDAFRNKVEEIRPDPRTAHEAEQLVFDVVRVVGKAVGLGMTTGPAAIPLLAGSEGFAETDKLQRQGVDSATARSVGTAAALGTGVGAVVPVAPLAKGFTGANVAKVVGLAGISGPATFMAQQQQSRDILERANYGEIAKQYDPLDPLGLTVSMAAPLFFGGFALRGGKPQPKGGKAGESAPEQPKQPQPTQDQIDAAMVQNLSTHAAAQEAVIAGELVRDYQKEKAPTSDKSDAFAGLPHDGMQERALRAVTGSPEPAQFGFEAGSGSHYAAFSKFVKQQRESQPLDTREHANQVDRIAESIVNDWQNGNADDITRTNGPKEIFEQMRKENEAKYFDKDGDITDAGNERYAEIENELAQKLAREHVGEPERKAVDLTRPEEAAKVLHAYLQAHGLEPGAIGGSAKSGSQYFELNGKKVRVSDHALPSEYEQANRELVLGNSTDEMRADGRFKTSGITEAEAEKRISDFAKLLLDENAAPASAQGAASRTADNSGAVEPTRPAVSKALAIEGGDKAKIQSVVNRVEEIQTTNPDMVVRAEADANGNVTERRTVAQELDRLRREAMDGTDTELGFADAELVRVAAECALSVGATA